MRSSTGNKDTIHKSFCEAWVTFYALSPCGHKDSKCDRTRKMKCSNTEHPSLCREEIEY